MSVEAEVTTKSRPYPNPLNDPRLPVEIWYAQGAVIGDASGGHAEVVILLNAAGAIRTGRAWSIETSLVQSTSENTVLARGASNNLDAFGPGLTNPIQKSWSHEMLGVSLIENPKRAGLSRDAHPALYLGAQSGSATGARIQMQWANLDGITFGFYATGYVWEPAALDLGHLKPVNGLI